MTEFIIEKPITNEKRQLYSQSVFDNLQHKCPKISYSLSQQYQQAGYWKQETFACAFTSMCREYRHDIAIIDGVRRISFAELQQNVYGIANSLQRSSLCAGDCVVLQLPNTAEFIELLLALSIVGIIPVLALPNHRHLEITNFFQFTQAKAYFIKDCYNQYDYRDLARQLQKEHHFLSHVFVKGNPQEFINISDLYSKTESNNIPVSEVVIQSEDVVCFQISGGTTGVPKLIPRRHTEYLYNMRTSATASAINQQTVYLCVIPIAHNFALACPGVMGCLLSGGTVVLSQDSSPEHCFSLMEKHRVTLTSLVPPLAILWQQAWRQHRHHSPTAIDSLEVLQVGGAKLSYEAAKHIESDLNCRLQQVFGMAEGLICYTGINDDNEWVYRTQGKPMSAGDEVRVVDSEGNEVAVDESGELLTRGPYTINGYYNMPEYNQHTFTRDGFYQTGDRVKRNAQGYLTVVGRENDLINRGGEKVAPEEVENILLSHDAIVDVSVLGFPDELYGESIHAFIVLDKNIDSMPIKKPHFIKFLKEKGLADYKVPNRIHFVDAFPTTSVGKVDKKKLRENIRQAYKTVSP